jgi:hypothetical protein
VEVTGSSPVPPTTLFKGFWQGVFKGRVRLSHYCPSGLQKGLKTGSHFALTSGGFMPE